MTDLTASIIPEQLAQHYSRFAVTERILLTGHSHQAWPDVSYEGQQAAWQDAAMHVDDKWEIAFQMKAKVEEGYRKLLADPDGHYAFAASTHDLVLRFLSVLPWRQKHKIITTDAEYHSLRRQLDRLSEENVSIHKVSLTPKESFSERLSAAIDEETAAVMFSAVFYQDAWIVQGLGEIAERAQSLGAEILVDAYHALNVIPFDVKALGLECAFIVGGGYKYCQLGEGNAFLRIPKGRTFRPIITGWYAEFGDLDQAPTAGVQYAKGGDAFAGSTYDPTSHYRAAKVFEFFEQQKLRVAKLRQLSQHQIGLMISLFDDLSLDQNVIKRDAECHLEDIGGFLALESPFATQLSTALKEAKIFTDVRGNLLRLGPAPYVTDAQITEAITMLGKVAKGRLGIA